MAIKQSFTYNVDLKANVIKNQNFNEFVPNQKPNGFQIRNFGTADLYISTRPNVSATDFEISIVAGGTRVFVIPTLITDNLYFFSTADAKITINATWSDNLTLQDLDQTQVSVLVNYSTTPEVKIKDGSGHALDINPDGSVNAKIVNVSPIEVNVDVSPEIEIKNDNGNPIGTSSADGSHITIGAKSDLAQTDETQTASLMAIIKGILNKVKGIITLIPTSLSNGNFRVSVQEKKSKYEDLGKIIDTTNLTAGSRVYSNYFDNYEWIRYISFYILSDQQYDLELWRQDETTAQGYAIAVNINQALSNNIQAWTPTSTGMAGIPGKKFRIAIKNSSAVTANSVKVYAHVHGAE